MSSNNPKFPYPVFNFRVSIDGVHDSDAYFQEVSGISAELQFDTINEGGNNNSQLKLPTRTKYSNLVLKKGSFGDTSSNLLDWCFDSMTDEGNLNRFKRNLKSVIVELKDEFGEPVFSWKFVKCYPVKWEISSFNAQKSEIAMETLELAYEYFKKV